MTIVNFDLTDSAGQPLTGYVLVTLDYPLDAPGAKLALPAIARKDLENGQASLDLAPSEVARVSYRFEVYQVSGDPPVETPVYDYRCLVPDSATPVGFDMLSQDTGVTRETLPSYRQAIARSLYNDEDFWQAFGNNFFTPRGEVVASAYYRRGDVVTANGGSYVCIAPLQVLGSTVSEPDKWQQLGSRGAQGTGTSGSLDANPTAAWDNSVVAVAQGAIRNLLSSTIATKAEVNARLVTGAPLPTGVTLQSNPARGNRTNLVASTAWVGQAIDDATIDRVPVGAAMMWFFPAIPTRWLEANGQVVSRAAFASLFALYGTTFNTGGETALQFRLPNYSAMPSTPPGARWIIYCGA